MRTITDLYDHNKLAYERVMERFKTHRSAVVIHPTGTGKAFVSAAVSSNFERVVYIAPTNYILEQNAKVCEKSPMCITYSALANMKKYPDADLIVFDELHRMGADSWGTACDGIIASNPKAKILATSATPIRHLEQRNIVEEMFKGDVVSEFGISEAWARGILPIPKYVIGMTTFDGVAGEYREKINANKKLSNAEKSGLLSSLDNLSKKWENADGVPQILKKYIDTDIRRIIVFAPSIASIQNISSSIREWFKEAGLKVFGIYDVNSAASISENNSKFSMFQENDYNGIKIIISVDMLNEGIHIPNVDACILLRSTISKNIFMQQIGRCFSCSSKKTPVILDLADNLTRTSEYDGLYQARDRFIELCKSNNKEIDVCEDVFVVDDRIAEYRELCERIDKVLVERGMQVSRDIWHIMLPLIRKEYERLGHIPNGFENKRVATYLRTYKMKKMIVRWPDRIAILKEMGFDPYAKIDHDKVYFDMLGEILKFKSECGYIPNFNEGRELYRFAIQHMCNAYKQIHPDRVQELYDLGFRRRTGFIRNTQLRFEAYYKKLITEYKSNGKIDKNSTEYLSIRTMLKKGDLSEEQVEMLSLIGIKKKKATTFFEDLEEAKRYKEEHGVLPPKRNYISFQNALQNNTEKAKMLIEIGYSPVDSTNRNDVMMNQAEEYFDKNGSLPERGTELGEWLFVSTRESFLAQRPDLKERLEKIGALRENKIEKKLLDSRNFVIEYVRKNGVPTPYEAKATEESKKVCRILRGYRSKTHKYHQWALENGLIQEYEKTRIMGQKLYESVVAELRDYISKHGYSPYKKSSLGNKAYSLMRRRKKENLPCDELNELLGMNIKEMKWRYNFAKLEAYFNEHNGDLSGLYLFDDKLRSWLSGQKYECTQQHQEKFLKLGIVCKGLRDRSKN